VKHVGANREWRTSPFLKKIPQVVVVVAILGWQLSFGWFYLGTKEGFGDFLYILERADCLPMPIIELYSERTTDDCTGYIYGSFLVRLFNTLGVGEWALALFGYTFIIVVTCLYIYAILIKSRSLQSLFYISLLFSPPIVLLYERANLDALVFILVTLYAFFMTRKSYSSAFIVAALASLFKFYTLPLLIWPIIRARQNKRLLLLALFFAVSAQIYIDTTRISQLPWDARNMFGNVVWGEYFLYLFKGSETHANFFLATALGLFLLFSIWLLVRRNTELFHFWTYSNTYDKNFFIVYFSIYMICYFTGLSVDYRLIFLLFAYIHLEKTLKMETSIKFSLRSLLLMTFFFSYNVEVLQPLGDLSQIFLIAAFLMILKPFWNILYSRLMNKIQIVSAMIVGGTPRNR
jgi:hypothetical protein